MAKRSKPWIGKTQMRFAIKVGTGYRLAKNVGGAISKLRKAHSVKSGLARIFDQCPSNESRKKSLQHSDFSHFL